MNEVKDRVGFLREGLFAKYVVALVGLVVFVLAINGAMEVWISYRGIKSSLNDGMSEKAEATAKRIQQSLSDLERQISWVTRASSNTTDLRRADYAQLLRQVPQVSQLSLLNAQSREQLRMTRQTVTLDSNVDFARDVRLTATAARGTSFAPAYFRGERPFTSIVLPHADGSTTVAEIDLDFLSEFLIDAQVGKVAFAYITDSRGDVLAASSNGPEVGKNLSALPQVAAVSKPGGVAPASGKDAKGNAVLTTSSLVPKLGWHVFFEQGTAQALTPVRDQLARIALLIGLGLVVAIIAGTIMARRMLVPITALQAGARRLGAGDFGHRIEVKTSDELEELANQFNGMAGQLAATYSNLESKVKERTRDLAQSINELKVLEEVGRAVASSLDLNAVLPTVAARALEITHADAVLIYGYDAGNHQFNLAGIDRHRPVGRRRPPRHRRRQLAARRGRDERRTDRHSPTRRCARTSLARRRDRSRLPLRAGGAAGRPDRHSGLAGGAAAERRRILRQSDRADEDVCAPGGAGDAQCAAVHRSGPQEPRAAGRE